MENLVKETYARNMWRIMDKFNVLPTEDRFKNLTTEQLSFILESMNRDNWEQRQLAKGITNFDDVKEDSDTSFLHVKEEDFEVLPDFLDADDINKKMLERLSESEKAKHSERLKAEFEDGGQDEPDLHHESIMEQIRKNLEELDDEVNNGKFKEEKTLPVITKDNIKEGLSMFDDEDSYI